MAVAHSETQLPYVVGPTLRQRLDLTLHLIEFGRQTIVLLGAPGSGRSRAMQEIAAEAPGDWQIVRIPGRDTATEAEILASLASELCEPDETVDEDPFRAIHEAVLELRAARRRLIILVDDADGYTAERLDFISGLFSDAPEGEQARVALSCAPGSNCAEVAGVRATSMHIVDIPPLDATGVWALADSWCRPLGIPRHALVPSEEEDEFFVACGGLPGAVIAALTARLDSGEAHPETRNRRPLPAGLKRAAAIIIVLVAAIGLALLALNTRRDRVRPEAPSVIEIELPRKTLDMPARPPENPGSTAHRAPQAVAEPPPGIADQSDAAENFIDGMTENQDPDADPAPAIALGPPAEQLRVPASEAPVRSVASSAPPASESLGAMLAPAATTDPAAIVEPAPVRPTEPPKQAASSSQALTSEIKETEENQSYTSKWVLTQPDESYVIQVFGARDRAAAEAFSVAYEDLRGRVAVLAISHQGAPWHVVVTGHYPDRDAARAAIGGLSDALQAHEPWARSVASLKK